MDSKSGYLKKNLFLFFVATVGTKLITFFMLPLYTSYISTSDYGVISYITSLADLVFPILTICIQNGLLRFVFEKDYSHADVFSTSIIIMLVGSMVYGFTAALVGAFLPYDYLYVLFFIFYGVASGIDNLLSYFYRGIGKSNIMMETSIIRAFMNCASCVILIVVFNYQMGGYFCGIYIGCASSILYGVVRCKIWKYLHFKYNKSLSKVLIKYSAPLIVSSAGWWVSSFIDRFIVTHFLGSSTNGVYSVAYRIPTIVSILSQIMVRAWTLSAIKDFDSEDKDGFISKTYRSYNFVLVIGTSAIVLLNIPLAKVLYAKDFFVAWKYTGPLVVSALFGALSNFYDGIFSHVMDTKSTAKAGIVAAVVNLILSISLVKPFGAMGVAWGTLISHLVVWIVKHLLCRKHIKIISNYIKDCILYIILCFQFLCGMNGFDSYFILLSIGLMMAICCVYKKELLQLLGTSMYSAKSIASWLKEKNKKRK